MNHSDNQALALGRYYRAARFPVFSVELILASYEREIDDLISNLPVRLQELEADIRLFIRNTVSQMMALPASSTHHHRCAGGLFYHSLETATLAANKARETAHSDRILAAFIAGLLHDIGKSASLFTVFKLEQHDYDPNFGKLDPREREGIVWDPDNCSLAGWCQSNDVQHLGLRFHYISRLGHVVIGAKLWRAVVPQKLMDFVARKPKTLDELERYLDGDFEKTTLNNWVSWADNESIIRDLNPGLRTQPKRTDLHIVRRFLEFQHLVTKNTSLSPFVLADVYIGDDETPCDLRLPFFVAERFHIRQFLDYIRSEDLYGHAPADSYEQRLLYILESHRVLKRTLPGHYSLGRDANSSDYVAPFRAQLIFPHEAEKRNNAPLCFFPMMQAESWRDLLPVRAVLNGSNFQRELVQAQSRDELPVSRSQ